MDREEKQLYIKTLCTPSKKSHLRTTTPPPPLPSSSHLLKLNPSNPKPLLPKFQPKNQHRIPNPHLDLILRHIIRLQAPPLALEARCLLEVGQVGGDGAEFLHGGLHARGGRVRVAHYEGVAPGCEGAEGAVEEVVCGVVSGLWWAGGVRGGGRWGIGNEMVMVMGDLFQKRKKEGREGRRSGGTLLNI